MAHLSNFGENLSALMAEHNIKAPALAKILQTDRSNITRYMRGDRLPSHASFLAILDYFSVSADVILGLKDYSSETKFLSPLPFGDRLRTIMEETKTTQYRIVKDTPISGGSMHEWLTNQSLPSVSNLIILATFMEVSVDYLLGRVR
ncbi:MAG: helix-turn-helix transcriptional regulator [Clostridia bacterium]|nr:helix-turn-helix transcriptional regulator [Clostridia bacterium]